MFNPLIIILFLIIFGIAGFLIYIGLRQDKNVDPLEERLAEFAARGDAVSLEEIELSQSFMERIIIPFATRLGNFTLRFTPQKALNEIEVKLERAGNPTGINSTTFFASRFIVAILIAFIMIIVFIYAPNQSVFSLQNMGLILLFSLIGFSIPNLLLQSKINRRQKEVRKALPDALDLLTICVEAGLGFEASMKKIQEKWEHELALSFGRALQEIQLGKIRREALRDMADRVGIIELDSFVAAVIQSEQLGVSMSKLLRIQSDDMRTRRRQAAEAEAQKAPVKMLFPMALLIFPTIMLILLGPAALLLMRSALGDILF